MNHGMLRWKSGKFVVASSKVSVVKSTSLLVVQFSQRNRSLCPGAESVICVWDRDIPSNALGVNETWILNKGTI